MANHREGAMHVHAPAGVIVKTHRKRSKTRIQTVYKAIWYQLKQFSTDDNLIKCVITERRPSGQLHSSTMATGSMIDPRNVYTIASRQPCMPRRTNRTEIQR